MLIDGVLIISVAIASMLAGMLGMGAGFLILPIMALFLPGFESYGHQLVLSINAVTAFVVFISYWRYLDCKWNEIVLIAFTAVIATAIGAYSYHFTKDRLCYLYMLTR